METLELCSSDREASLVQETKKSLIGIDLNKSPVESPVPEVVNDSPNTQLVLPQQITFSSLLNGDYDAIEEQMLLELQSTFPKHQESIDQRVQELGPINSKRVAGESDPTLTPRLVPSLRMIPPKDIMVPHKYQTLNTSLGKQPELRLRGNERNLKRVVEVGESSSSKIQKKDSPVALFVANDGIKERNHNNSNPSSKPITPIMNALYDPKFEEMGLPIDPHIRCLMYMQGGPSRDWYKKFM